MWSHASIVTALLGVSINQVILNKLGRTIGIVFDAKSQRSSNGGLSSYRLYERDNKSIWVRSRQKTIEGYVVAPAVYATVSQDGESAFNPSRSGLYFSPWLGLGLANRGLFRDDIESNQYAFSTWQEEWLDEGVVTVIRITGRVNNGNFVEYRFDLTKRFPRLLEMKSSQNIQRFLDYVELDKGIWFPMTAITSRGPFLVEGKGELFDVKVWKFHEFGNRSPQPTDFDFSVDNEMMVFGIDLKPPIQANAIELFESGHWISREVGDPIVDDLWANDDRWISELTHAARGEVFATRASKRALLLFTAFVLVTFSIWWGHRGQRIAMLEHSLGRIRHDDAKAEAA